MKTETMNRKILDLIEKRTVKFRDGGVIALISPKQQSQLFNLLHREFNAHRMNLKRIDTKTVHILVSDWPGNVIIDSEISTY